MDVKEYTQLTMDDYIKSKTEIKENLGGIVKSFVRIGWQLTRISKSEAYKLDGYGSITEFAKAEYDMNPSGVSRFMKVYETYSVEGDTPELKEQYKEFKFSQLTELLQIDEKDREIFTPEAKREDIREFQRFEKENGSNPDNLLNWKEARTPEEKLMATVQEFFRENREILNCLYESEEYLGGNVKEMVEMIAPSGSRSYRKGTTFLMFYGIDQGIKVKDFGDPAPRSLTWQQFSDIVRSIFDEAGRNGNLTWEVYFHFGEGYHAKGQEEDPEYQEEPASEQQETETSQKEEEQIPGQDSIMDHPELLPEEESKAEIAPAQKSSEKTEEQRYSEQQAAIDRETKRKLQEQEDQEKMEHLPSDEPQKTKRIHIAQRYYEDIKMGVMTFWPCKNDRFHPGDSLDLLEFAEGRHTGRIIQTEITYILDDLSCLEDGYCILGIKITGAV